MRSLPGEMFALLREHRSIFVGDVGALIHSRDSRRNRENGPPPESDIVLESFWFGI